MKIQRFLLALVLGVLVAITLSLIVQNRDVVISVQWWGWIFPDVSLALAFGLVALLAAGATMAAMSSTLLMLGQQQKRANRELERRDVSREEAVEKVKVLEIKIQTLEKALQEALKNRQPR